MTLELPLTLHIAAQKDADVESYQISVLDTPVPNWGGPVHQNRFETQTIQALLNNYHQHLVSIPFASSPAAQIPIKNFGITLYQALPLTVQTLFEQCQQLAQQRAATLSIVLQFDWDAQHLLALPWELLHAPQATTFIAFRHSITRQLAWHKHPQPDSAPLQPSDILGIWAAPSDQPPLTERERYQPNPQYPNGLIWVAGAATRLQAEQILTLNLHRGLHIVAHGAAGAQQLTFAMAWETASRQTEIMTANDIVVWLQQFPQLEWVYLEICSAGGAQIGQAAEQSLASQLVTAGIPAVLAFQTVVTQSAAGQFSQTFYQAWQVGQTQTQAITAGRRNVRLQGNNPIEWSLPVYCQAQTKLPERTPVLVRAANWVIDRNYLFISRHNLYCGIAIWLAGCAAYWLAVQDHQLTRPAAQQFFLFCGLVITALPNIGAWLHYRTAPKKPTLRLIVCHKFYNANLFGLLAWMLLAGWNLTLALWPLFDKVPERFLGNWFGFCAMLWLGYISSVQGDRQTNLFSAETVSELFLPWTNILLALGNILLFASGSTIFWFCKALYHALTF
jgi:hypothetical protein